MTSTFIPKIVVEGSTSNEPFVKFTQNYQWTTKNPCLSVVNGYTNLNGILINGNDNTNTILSSNYSNIAFGIIGNNTNFIFKRDTTELLKIANNGNVGIGTTDYSSYKLNINGSVNASSIYKNGNELNNIYLLISSNYWLKKDNDIYIDPSPNIINVGIGTSTPYANLHIYGTTENNRNSYTLDGNIMISKFNSESLNPYLTNTKIGYFIDDFTIGNYNIITNSWTKQLSINKDAPENSIYINNNGNIGIGTTNTSTFKFNINGVLNATSLTGSGANITNIDYNNISSTNKPNLKNLDNWNLSLISGTQYVYSEYNIGIGQTTGASPLYKLNISGSLNVLDNININGNNINNIYLSKTEANNTYLNAVTADNKYYYLIKDPVTANRKISFLDIYQDYGLVLGIPENQPGATTDKTMLTIYGTVDGTKFVGDGTDIRNIKYTNINGVPIFILKTDVERDYYNKIYIDSTYLNTTIPRLTDTLYPKLTDFRELQDSVAGIYKNAITKELLETIADSFLNEGNEFQILYSNVIKQPLSINNYNDSNLSSAYFGFGTNYINGIRVNVNGILKADELKSVGDIYEYNNKLSNIYISSNVLLNNILPYYDTIVDRQRTNYEFSNIYPPQNTLFNVSYTTNISNSTYGNGRYVIDASMKFIITENTNYPYHTIFNNNINPLTLSASGDYPLDISTNTYSFNLIKLVNNQIYQKISTKYKQNNIEPIIYGHWIQLYYEYTFSASKLEIIINSDFDYNSPKKIFFVATNDIINPESSLSYNWDILLNSYEINLNDYISIDEFTKSVIIDFPLNIKSYLYYRIIITELHTPRTDINGVIQDSVLKLHQIKIHGYEPKRNFRSSGYNIYTYSNVSINTIDNYSPYSLNVNGLIYTSSNIYVASNIGIGTTNPLGNLHIGSINNSNDGTLIIARHNGTSGRIFKMGYDSSFNFTIGDYGTSGNLSWKPQFYINYQAPSNSFIINNLGNIGINTNSHIDSGGNTYKLSINGSTNIKGFLNQEGNNLLNKFSGSIYASNNVFIDSNLNAWNINASNIKTTDSINANGVISTFSNIGIGISTSLSGSLHIKSINNSYGIWNSAPDLTSLSTLKTFIGKNTSFGFYNNYNLNNNITNDNTNYLSWNTVHNDTAVFNITSLGRIGIGITNPDGILQVGTGNRFRISSIDNDYAIIGLKDNDTSNTKIHLKGSDNSINYYSENHIFYNLNKDEKIRIDINGNIGIGTTILNDILNDTYKLSVNGSIYSSNKIDVFNSVSIGSINNNSDGNLTIFRTNSDNSYNNIFKFGFDLSTQNFIMGNIISNEWRKQLIINSTAPSNSLFINNNGKIGINNFNPLGTLHIGSNSDINNSGSIVISQKHPTNGNRNFKMGYNDNGNDNGDFIFGDFGNNTNQTLTKQFYINSNAFENSLMINSYGNTGIGTINTTNDKKLVVYGNTEVFGSFVQSKIGGITPNNLFIGNVGICTNANNTDYNLNVIGNAKISNGIDTNNILNSGDLFQKGVVRIGPTVSRSTIYDYNFYVNTPTFIDSDTKINGNLSHNSGNFLINSILTTVNSNIKINGILNQNSNLGINIGSYVFSNVLQVEEGGKLRIANNSQDYTSIGTNNNPYPNTRIILNGASKSVNPGNIEYYSTSSSGNHIFYNGTTANETMRINNNGNISVINELHVSRDIKENSQYLSNIYVRLDQLSNLSVNNFNINKKYGYTSSTTIPITLNITQYYKFDINLSSLKSITLPSSPTNIKYRIFNIKCFINYGIFEMNADILPSILQYDIYMSSGQSSSILSGINNYKIGININAIGTPENYKLENLLPTYITLLRTNDFDYLSIISKINNLSVSYIIEDYLG